MKMKRMNNEPPPRSGDSKLRNKKGLISVRKQQLVVSGLCQANYLHIMIEPGKQTRSLV